MNIHGAGSSTSFDASEAAPPSPACSIWAQIVAKTPPLSPKAQVPQLPRPAAAAAALPCLLESRAPTETNEPAYTCVG
jgi:hypothetical protein